MNKKLVAAALGLAFAAPVFADSSNVTLYGRVHQALDHQSVDDNGDKIGGNFALEDVSSRFGIKGQEDLGGGLSLVFGYEFSVAADANAGVGGRHSYLGMKGAWGTFVAGKQDGGNETVAPLYTQASLTGGVSNQGGPLTTIGGGSAVFNDTVAIQRVQRLDNSFGYKTNIAGVSIEARHALTGTNNNFNNDEPVAGIKENGTRQTEIAATYKLGALTIGGGLQAFDQQAEDPTTAASPERTVQGVAAYNFGAFSLAGLVAQTSLYGTNAANGEDSNTEYLLSATFPLTANSGLFGSYSDSERNNQVDPAEVNQAQIAYYYDLSKRTRTYVGFNRAENEIVAGANTGEKFEQDNFTIGLRHNF
ncbi:MAG: porin [Limnobacter sp.]|uniref:porin n=1 Tax=Limnobacter sp. TaxID=2003368 RepID=UPI0032EC983A